VTAIYRYTFLDMTGQAEADFTLRCPSEEIAADLAREMLPSSGFASLEIRKGAELIYRLGKTDADRAVERRLRSRRGVLPKGFTRSPQAGSAAESVDIGGHKNTVVPFRRSGSIRL
jgi:hypothetical protein